MHGVYALLEYRVAPAPEYQGKGLHAIAGDIHVRQSVDRNQLEFVPVILVGEYEYLLQAGFEIVCFERH